MESESIALPLGDSPLKILSFLNPGLSGFEPPSAGVKVLCLNRLATAHHSNMIGKSAKRDSNSRPSPWQGDALPLSHSRIKKMVQSRGLEPLPSLPGLDP